jgi:uncharacterized protein (DUF58 family)
VNRQSPITNYQLLFVTYWQRISAWLSLNGRIRVLQPIILLPAPLILAIALAFPFRWLFFLGYAWLILLIIAYLWVRTLAQKIDLQRTLREAWAEVGDELGEYWLLENTAWIPLLWLEIDDASSVPGYQARRVAACGPRTSTSWQTSARCGQRGIYTLGPVTLRMADPFGLIGAEWPLGEARRIVVYPALVKLPPLRLPRGQSGGLAQADLLQQATTPSVAGLREYTPGDLLSRIHWPTVARTQRLMVKEFDQERAGALWIAIDLRSSIYTNNSQPDLHPPLSQLNEYGQSSLVTGDTFDPQPTTLLELAIVVAGSLAAQALAEGRVVGLLGDDGQRRVVPPGQGTQQLWRILGALVEMQANGTTSLVDLLARGPGSYAARAPGAALALITADLGGSWAGALAGWHSGHSGAGLTILVGKAGSQCHDLAVRLAGIGVDVQLFRLGEQLTPLRPARPRAVTRVSPLGRVRRS